MKTLAKHGPWLVPLFLALFLGGAQIYHLREQVIELRIEMNDINNSGLDRLKDVEWRVKIIEDYCCPDKIETTGVHHGM